MREQWAWGGGLGVVGVGLLLWAVNGPATAVGEPGSAVPALAVAVVTGGAEAEYVGSTKCKKCHLAEHKSWAKLKHANALEALMPGKATEAKTKAKLDPNKDYSTDPNCVTCHVTGFGKKGGYAIPDAKDENTVKAAKEMAGVGCESCHGPGSEYNKLHEEIMKSKRKYKVDEMIAAGMTKTDGAVCLTCHNDKSPTFDKSAPFDYEKKKTENTHDHDPPKQRE